MQTHKLSLQKQKRSKQRLVILYLLFVVLITAACVIIFGHTKLRNPFVNPPVPQAQTQTTSQINLLPPTEEDAQKVEEHKQEIVASDIPKATSDSAPQAVSKQDKAPARPTIISAINGKLKAYIPAVVEEGGICTAVFTNGSQNYTIKSQAFADAQSTNCGSLNYDSHVVKAGWSVVVTYDSEKATGSSDAYTIQ